MNMDSLRLALVFTLIGCASLNGNNQDPCDQDISTCADTIGGIYPNFTSPWQLREFMNGRETSKQFCVNIGKIDPAPDPPSVCYKNISSCGDDKGTRVMKAIFEKVDVNPDITATLLHIYACRIGGCPKNGTTWRDIFERATYCNGDKGLSSDLCRKNIPKILDKPEGGETKCMINDASFCGYPATESDKAKVVMSFVDREPQTCTFYIASNGQSIKSWGLYVFILGYITFKYTQ